METSPSRATELIRQIREQFEGELRAEGEQLEKLELGLRDLRGRHQKLEAAVRQQVDALEKALTLPPTSPPPSPAKPVVAVGAPVRPVASAKVASPPPVTAPASNDGEEKVLKDAQRFARLLVSEIELYNRSVVAEARKEGNLYGRLRTAIDRSRQAYEKRFGNTPAKHHSYFHDELVRTLASNDPALLGSDYPGPSA